MIIRPIRCEKLIFSCAVSMHRQTNLRKFYPNYCYYCYYYCYYYYYYVYRYYYYYYYYYCCY